MEKFKKSPLKDNPLRIPGQSLDDEIQKAIDDAVGGFVLPPVIMILLTVWTWLQWYQIIPISKPILMTITTIGIVINSFFNILKIRKRIKALRLGRDGERAVGQT